MDGLHVREATADDRLPLQRMLELYQHDLSHLWDQDLDRHGEYGYELDRYFHGPPGRAFVFTVDGSYAGLALVDDQVRRPGGELWMVQFFVMKKYRRRHVGRAAARHVFGALPGRWQVGQMPGNAPAQAFWRAVVGELTEGRFAEHAHDDGVWQGTIQSFDNRAQAGGEG